ncbi:capsule assembly Wzi family protein [Reichenbachiella versicolor]|uniref:capsule assembly Wzi family protein n=1 Tax=Reichenbachiella versicolor TaxID=1821036 RepID=UPI000D6DC5C5|nr:capsule assembly Wzi family protein [Reichenbachiella versicolor]
MKRYSLYFSILFVLALHPKQIFGQVLYPNSELLNYYRFYEIKNIHNQQDRLNIFPSIMHQYNSTDSAEWNPWKIKTDYNHKTQLLPIRLENHYNTQIANGYNDGALWKGAGYTGSIQGGFTGDYGILKFTFAPIFFYSENSEFQLAPQNDSNNSFNYQFKSNRIDYVQRFGNKSFSDFDFGQSEIRLALKNFTIGLSTENIVWGPAQQNPIMMSNQAAGIPHIDLGTNKPINTKIGLFEAKFYYGILEKSDYFDQANTWNYRYWSGTSIGYSPSFLPSLTLGFNRSFYKKMADFKATDLLVFLGSFDDTDGDPAINDDFDQLGSLSVRWLFKEVGFETYFEFAKNDFGGKLHGTTPEHSRGYVIGFSKYFELKEEDVLKLTYEHTSLDKPKSYVYKYNNSWYTHAIVRSGYTNKGQLIGAGIGPGSISDYFEAIYINKSSYLQLAAQRTRFDDDYFYETQINNENNHDHEWTLSSSYSKFFNAYQIGTVFEYSYRKNKYFVENNNITNFYFGLTIQRYFR